MGQSVEPWRMAAMALLGGRQRSHQKIRRLTAAGGLATVRRSDRGFRTQRKASSSAPQREPTRSIGLPQGLGRDRPGQILPGLPNDLQRDLRG